MPDVMRTATTFLIFPVLATKIKKWRKKYNNKNFYGQTFCFWLWLWCCRPYSR